MKKFLSVMLTAAMLTPVIPNIAMADGGTVISITAGPGYQSDVNHNGMTVTPEINVVSGETPAGYKYQWYAQNNWSTEYKLPWETGPSITLGTQVPVGYYLNFEATPLDSSGNAIGDTVKAVHYISNSPMKGKSNRPSPTAAQSSAYASTPSEYTFEIDGVKLILLDWLYNGEFYVMMEDSVGKRKFDTDNSKAIVFDPTVSTSVAYWLNNDFLAGDYLPASVKSHITQENWPTDYNTSYGVSNKTYKVGLLSYSEYLQYMGRFGFALSDYTSADGWEAFWLRSSYRSAVDNNKIYVCSENGTLGNLLEYSPDSGSGYVRPTFRLSEDFFRRERVENAGAKVREVIKESKINTVIQISDIPGYQADVDHNGMVVTPEINVVSGDTPAGYLYQWYAGDNGEYKLPWETGASITINSQIPAGWLWFEATPVDSYGDVIGKSIKVRYISTYPMKGRNDIPALTAEQSAAWQDTPSEYSFEVEGVKLILLDKLYNGQYYVMMENGVGKRAFDTRGNSNSFDPTKQQNIGYWLNNDFLDGDYLPSSVKNYITEDNWTTEGDSPEWGNSNKTYKVGLLSYSEYIKYLGRFGLWLPEYDSQNPKSWEGFWLRTLHASSRPYVSAKNGGTDDGTGIAGRISHSYDANNGGHCYVRPTFRLSADFFKRVKVDNPGTRIQEIISVISHDTVISVTDGPGYEAEVNHNGMVVTPEINVISGETPAGYKYQWYAGDNGEYKLPWETGASITINSQIPAGWLWFEATPVDIYDNAIGESVKVKYISTYPMKGRTDMPALTAEQSAAWRNTPAEYSFEVDGVKFILLDRLYNGQYYVMMENGVGKRAFDTRGRGYMFDPKAPENIGYWLNNDFMGGDYLPSSVKNYITEGNWTTEGDSSSWANSNKTYMVGLLSYSEYIQYLGRFGLWLPEYDSAYPRSWEGFWLRTVRAADRPFASAKNGGTDDGTGIMGKLTYFETNNSGVCYVRPTFRLSADFFKNVKLNTSNMGDKVKSTIVEDCTAGELSSVYSATEIANIMLAVSSVSGNDTDEACAKDEAYYDITIKNRYTESVDVTISVQVTGATAYSDSKVISCLPGNTRYHIDLKQLKYGQNSVTINVAENGATFYTEAHDINLVKTRSDEYGYRAMNLGINNGALEKDILIAEKMGIRHIRWAPEWDYVEKTQGVYDFSETDRAYNILKEHGFEITCIMAYSNPIYSGSGTDDDKIALTTDEQKDAFVDYCLAMTERYGDGFKAIEIWNEPNHKDALWKGGEWTDYFDTADRVLDALKPVAPALPIYIGSIDVSKQGTQFMNEMLASGLYEKCDGISFHPYYHSSTSAIADTGLITHFNNFNNVLYNYGGWKTMPVTEIGFTTSGDQSVEAKMAREVIKGVIYSQMDHQENVHIYCFRDHQRETNSFGALDVNYRVTEGVFALAQYEATLGDAIYFGKVDAGNSKISAHLFRKNDEWIVAAWTTSGTASYNPAGLVSAEDYYGNAKSVSSGTVQLGVEPAYLYGFSNQNAANMLKGTIASAYTTIKNEYSINSINTLISNINSGLPTNAQDIRSLAESHYSTGLSLIDASGTSMTTKQSKMTFLFKWQHIGEMLCKWYGVFAEDMPETVAYQRALTAVEEHDDIHSDAIANYALRYAKDALGYANAGQSGYAAGAELNANLLLGWANSVGGTENEVTVSAKENGAEVIMFGGGEASVVAAFYDSDDVLISAHRLTLTGTEGSSVKQFISCADYSTVKVFRWNDYLEPLWTVQKDNR